MSRTANDEEMAVSNLGVYQVRKLERRRDRGHWRKYGLETLMEMASDEFVELAEAIEALDDAIALEDRIAAAERVRLEAADVANCVAFIFDNAERDLVRAIRD